MNIFRKFNTDILQVNHLKERQNNKYDFMNKEENRFCINKKIIWSLIGIIVVAICFLNLM